MRTRSAEAAAGGGALGRLLREWRTARGLSQLDLAIEAGFSTRHLSFVETGRSRPSRQTLLTLAEALEVPLRERNRLLEAAGYAPAFRETPIDAGEMTHLRGLLQFILDRHAPYAAVVLDRYSTCLMGNAAASWLLGALAAPSLIPEGTNLLRAVFHPEGVRRWIVNWDEVARHLLARAERELGEAREDDRARALVAELREHAGLAASRPLRASPAAADLLLPVHVRTPDVELRLFSTIMTLGTPTDITLQELRIETFFPADSASDAEWRRLTAQAT